MIESNIAELKTYILALPGFIDVAKRELARAIAKDVHYNVLAKSPVDTGEFMSAWEQSESETGGVYEITIGNDLIYAEPIDIGSPVGSLPWPSAGPRTIQRADRIWSSQAPEGVTTPVISEIDLEKYMSIFNKALGG